MAETKKTLIGNIKGPQGEPGEKGDPGNTGATGQRGSGWVQGMAITGTDTEGTVFPESGIDDALVNDNYLNTYTGNTYRCILGGDASTAEWVYTGNLKGPKGESPQIIVDAVLGDSENPVQNKVITDALNEKADNSELDKDVEGSYAAGVDEEISGINADLAQNTYSFSKNAMIPYLYKFITATQPLFVISESDEDTMHCNGRACKRNSSAKALIFKVGGSLKQGTDSSGYALISYTRDDCDCTQLTNYGGVINTGTYKTPAGNSVAINIMASRWSSNDFPVTVTVEGENKTINGISWFYTDGNDNLFFMLAMADFYLF